MEHLVKIDNTAPRSEAIVRIYGNRIVLNRNAVSLLNLNEGDRVDVYQDEHEKTANRDRIFVGKCRPTQGYSFKLRNKTARIDSASLARSMANHLQGLGSYRICPEWVEFHEDNKCYNIFFKRYES